MKTVASQNKRFLNLVIDNAIAIIVVSITMSGSIIGPTLPYLAAVIFVRPFYILGMEFFFQKTVGKFVTRTKVVNINGTKPSFHQVLGRTVARYIPFNQFSFLKGSRPVGWHDSLSKTFVVDDDYSTEDVLAIDKQSINKGSGGALRVILIAFIVIISLGIISSAFLASISTYKQPATQGRGGKPYLYSDALSGATVSVPNGTWGIHSRPGNEGWTILRVAKSLAPADIEALRSTISPAPTTDTDLNTIDFVSVTILTYDYGNVPVNPGKAENKNFHDGLVSREVNDGNTPATVVSTEYVNFKSHNAYMSHMAYKNKTLGTTSKLLMLTFIYDNKGYQIIYAGANPLYEKYLNEAQGIIDSIEIGSGKKSASCTDGLCG